MQELDQPLRFACARAAILRDPVALRRQRAISVLTPNNSAARSSLTLLKARRRAASVGMSNSPLSSAASSSCSLTATRQPLLSVRVAENGCDVSHFVTCR